jgi:hypothetical protein
VLIFISKKNRILLGAALIVGDNALSATKLHHVTTKVGRIAFADEGNGTPVLF